ncbi:MAG: hypothetical protein CVU64_23645 [Deltaproteobacteria bacterium HGW-Deltaproteobacteria-21]|nr:MAG: hypothetical protein CVU64_23645 [Deltaproteobacteria bacterium HGW-Deltaproteobacteria-21]
MGYLEILVIWASASVLLAPIAGTILHGIPEKRRSQALQQPRQLKKPRNDPNCTAGTSSI